MHSLSPFHLCASGLVRSRLPLPRPDQFGRSVAESSMMCGFRGPPPNHTAGRDEGRTSCLRDHQFTEQKKTQSRSNQDSSNLYVHYKIPQGARLADISRHMKTFNLEPRIGAPAACATPAGPPHVLPSRWYRRVVGTRKKQTTRTPVSTNCVHSAIALSRYTIHKSIKFIDTVSYTRTACVHR